MQSNDIALAASVNDANAKLRFLAEASSLLASSLEYDIVLDRVVSLTVPDLADICALDLINDAGEIDRVKLVAADAAQKQAVEQLRMLYPPTWTSPHVTPRVLRSGQPVLLAQIDQEVESTYTQNAEHLRLIRMVGIHSQVVVPLIARGRTIGALSLCHSTSARRYGNSDVEFAVEFARRIAAAVDNAGLYRAMERANRAKADFLAVVSHELRTPINAILGYADLWLTGIPEPQSTVMNAQIQRVLWSAQHLREMVDSILTFSRLDAGKEAAKPQETTLEAIIEGVVALIEPLALQRGLHFSVEMTEPQAIIITDPGKARQILLNLLSNAVKFTPAGSVQLKASCTDQHVDFTVSDTGIGIQREHLEAIFEPFWQVEQSATRRVGGTGLGLSVARSLALLLGGSITAESEPGSGSRFGLRLPRRLGSAAQPL
jgi:signal transduction histidine kinase